jgi:hypothetical protein
MHIAWKLYLYRQHTYKFSDISAYSIPNYSFHII